LGRVNSLPLKESSAGISGSSDSLSLLALGFVKPTDIQRRALPSGTSGRDVVGVAETGSGKTLAYSLPVISHLLRTSPTPRARAALDIGRLDKAEGEEGALERRVEVDVFPIGEQVVWG
jgi:hypothetical protein